jgi:hypothetical protein
VKFKFSVAKVIKKIGILRFSESKSKIYFDFAEREQNHEMRSIE